MSRINLGRRGTHAKLSTLDTAHKPSPIVRKGLSPGQKGPIVPTETINNPHRPEKQTQMAIIDYAQNRNHKQSATEAHQQDKPRKAKCTRKPIPRPWTQTATPPQPGKGQSQPQRQESNTNLHRPGGLIPNYQKQLSTNTFEIAFLQTFAIFWGKYLWWSLFLLKFFTKVFTKLFY